jgi:hypothetical protein
MTTRKGDWRQLYSGGRTWPFDPRVEEINIVDIAHALGQICRFTGHTQEFYSVAEHSIHVSRNCLPEHALWGLLHDAAEAYLGDIARPIKVSLRQAGVTLLEEAEERLLGCIAQWFGLELPVPADVWYADNVLLATEARDLLLGGPIHDWTAKLPQPLPEKIEPLDSRTATHRFLRRAAELGVGVL